MPFMAYHGPPDRMLMNGKGPYGDSLVKAHESFTVTKGKNKQVFQCVLDPFSSFFCLFFWVIWALFLSIQEKHIG